MSATSEPLLPAAAVPNPKQTASGFGFGVQFMTVLRKNRRTYRRKRKLVIQEILLCGVYFGVLSACYLGREICVAQHRAPADPTLNAPLFSCAVGLSFTSTPTTNEAVALEPNTTVSSAEYFISSLEFACQTFYRSDALFYDGLCNVGFADTAGGCSAGLQAFKAALPGCASNVTANQTLTCTCVPLGTADTYAGIEAERLAPSAPLYCLLVVALHSRNFYRKFTRLAAFHCHQTLRVFVPPPSC